MSRREKIIRVRLTADQHQMLSARCEEAGIPVSAWCRYLVIGDEKVEPLPRPMISAVDKATLLELERHQGKILMVDSRLLKGAYPVELWNMLTEIESSIIAVGKLISGANAAVKLAPNVKIYHEDGEYTHYIGIRVTRRIHETISQSLRPLNITMSDYIRERILSINPSPIKSLSTEDDLLTLKSILPRWNCEVAMPLDELSEIQRSIYAVLRAILKRNEQVIV